MRPRRGLTYRCRLSKQAYQNVSPGVSSDEELAARADDPPAPDCAGQRSGVSVTRGPRDGLSKTVNPQSNSDRIYLAVKREVLSGRFAPGERVDAQSAGARAVRQHHPRFAPPYTAWWANGLVQTQASEGFHAPPLTEMGVCGIF